MRREAGWNNEVLVEHLSGEHDGSETYDEEIYDRLSYNEMQGEAHKFIPARWLNDHLSTETQKDPSGSWRVQVHYSTDRFLAAQADWQLTATDVVDAPIPSSAVTLDTWGEVTPSWPYTFQIWNEWKQRGTPPELEADQPIEAEEYGEWGGHRFVARGSMFVWIAAESVEAVENDQGLVENALPTAFDPDDFQGQASLIERV